MRAPAGLASREMLWITQSHSLHSMGDDEVCNVSTEPSGRGMLTRNTSLARVLFFLDPATPIRASTSAFLSFRIPTQSTLYRYPNISWSFVNINNSNHIWSLQPLNAKLESLMKLTCLYIRQSHIAAGIQRHFDDSGAFDVHFPADGCVTACNSASLVEAMGLHTSSIIAYKNLQDHWLLHTLELRGSRNLRLTE